jgi:hypothetical protein
VDLLLIHPVLFRLLVGHVMTNRTAGRGAEHAMVSHVPRHPANDRPLDAASRVGRSRHTQHKRQRRQRDNPMFHDGPFQYERHQRSHFEGVASGTADQPDNSRSDNHFGKIAARR